MFIIAMGNISYLLQLNKRFKRCKNKTGKVIFIKRRCPTVCGKQLIFRWNLIQNKLLEIHGSWGSSRSDSKRLLQKISRQNIKTNKKHFKAIQSFNKINLVPYHTRIHREIFPYEKSCRLKDSDKHSKGIISKK